MSGAEEGEEQWHWQPVAADRIVLKRGNYSGSVIWFGGNTALRDQVLADHETARWAEDVARPALERIGSYAPGEPLPTICRAALRSYPQPEQG